MVMHLQGRRVVRAQELAERFEISLRTVYRDVAALGEAGVPIAGEAGVGYSLVKGYHLPPVMLTADEATALFVGAEMVKQFTDASLSHPMEAVIDKLRAVLPRDRQEHVERLARQTVIRGKPGQPAAEHEGPPALAAVQRGVAQRRVLRMVYRTRSRGDVTSRDVEPLGVVYYGGAWYVIAWCRLRQDVRHFRTNRIIQLDVLEESFPPRQDFSLAEHLEREAGDQERFPARVWFSDDVVERARRESCATLVEIVRRDGGAEYEMFTFSLQWLAKWLLSFGAEAEAIGPDELRDAVRVHAEEILRRYADKMLLT